MKRYIRVILILMFALIISILSTCLNTDTIALVHKNITSMCDNFAVLTAIFWIISLMMGIAYVLRSCVCVLRFAKCPKSELLSLKIITIFVSLQLVYLYILLDSISDTKCLCLKEDIIVFVGFVVIQIFIFISSRLQTNKSIKGI